MRPQAWSATILAAVKMGLLINTGRVIGSRRPSNHARKAAVYRKRAGI
jgi:hypothetical protein